MKLGVVHVPSPLGGLTAATRLDHPALVALGFDDGWPGTRAELEARFGLSEWAESDPLGVAPALEAWFSGALDALDSLPVDPGGTPFQRRVWDELRRIPRGAVRTYGQMARALESPGAARAVGGANRANPIAIVIPCHRVVAADGTLGGYAGQWHRRGTNLQEGPSRKRWLLAHEGVDLSTLGR